MSSVPIGVHYPEEWNAPNKSENGCRTQHVTVKFDHHGESPTENMIDQIGNRLVKNSLFQFIGHSRVRGHTLLSVWYDNKNV